MRYSQMLMSDTQRCQECGRPVADHESVVLGGAGADRLLCSRCCNQFISRQVGLDFQHPDFTPLTLTDCRGASRHFEFQTRLTPGGLVIEALELRGGRPQGYKFSVLGDFEADAMELFSTLYGNMRQELARMHIEETQDGLQITKGETVRGMIDYDSDSGGAMPLLKVDGREMSWEQLGRMLTPYEGFRFKLQILDPSDVS